MNRALGVLIIAAVALAGCGRSERAESAAVAERAPRRAQRLELPAAEGPKHDVGTFGEECKRGAPAELGAPDPDWSERVLEAALGRDGELLGPTDSPIRIRFPRAWDDSWSDSTIEPFRVTSDYSADDDLAEVVIATLPDIDLGGLGDSPWDARIELLEAANALEAKAATPVERGRCLVIGQDTSGVFAALLSPMATQETLVALATFPGTFGDDASLEDVKPATLAVTLRVLNSVEEVDRVPPAAA